MCMLAYNNFVDYKTKLIMLVVLALYYLNINNIEISKTSIRFYRFSQ